jgi:SnoaL-like domain
MDEPTINLAIHTALLTYCRGIDRLDGAMVASAFHPGAELVDYGPQPLTIETFADYAPGSLAKKFVATQHRISNVRIELDDARTSAKVETYVLAFHVQDVDNIRLLHTFNGRYIDRFEERNGAWKIAKRVLRNDWSKVETIDAPMSGTYVASGRGGSPDPLDD